MFTIPKTLLSKGSTNAKTVKNSLKTYILYLASYKQNSKGINLCPNASAGCIVSCLFTAGRGKFSNVANARINKANFYVENRELFLDKLYAELFKINISALKAGEKVAIRLNGTSDIDFISQLNNQYNTDVLKQFQHLVFYDYTKILGKVKKYVGQNYHLTYSRSETTNNFDLMEALHLGANVAVVFKKIPDTFRIFSNTIDVVNGDESDIVMIENKSKVLGLKAKGKAIKDTSNFVII